MIYIIHILYNILCILKNDAVFYNDMSKIYSQLKKGKLYFFSNPFIVSCTCVNIQYLCHFINLFKLFSMYINKKNFLCT